MCVRVVGGREKVLHTSMTPVVTQTNPRLITHMSHFITRVSAWVALNPPSTVCI